LFKLEGFSGWNGHDVGMPNISSVQDYDHGPDKMVKAVVPHDANGGSLPR
jgi:predicted transcriptional regulator